MFISRFLSLAACAASCAFGVDTKTWTQNDAADFEKATLKGVTLASTGKLTLAPVFKELYDTGLPLVWSSAADARGTVYLGGSEGKLFAVGSDGKGRLAATLTGGDIYALAVNRRNEVFAATAPDAKVWKIVNGKGELFYDSKQKYIWAMAFDASGRLYLATGEKGEIHRVTPEGKGAVFFETGEAHTRSLALDAAGNLYAGTEPSGLVLRITPQGEGFVVYQTARREVTALVVGKDGTVYAAGVGQKAVAPPIPIVPPPAAAAAATTVQGAQGVPIRVPPPPTTLGPTQAIVSGGSEVYRIGADGAPHRIWMHAQHLVYALGLDGEGRLLVGTGNNGLLYRIDSDTIYTRLIDAEPGQLTAFIAGANGVLYVATSNPGKLFRLGPELEKSGTVESDVHDAAMFTYWGRLRFEGTLRGGTIGFETRSGNLDRPQKNWSPWQKPSDGRIVSPPARFLAWRATLGIAQDGSTPELSLVESAYQAKNLAPQIERIEITPANYKFPGGPSLNLSSSNTLSLPPFGQPKRTTPSLGLGDGGGAATMNYEHGSIGARWKASDPNGDPLEATVEIRGRDEKEWKPLKSSLKDSKYSFDSTSWPDGEYKLRVTVSDAPDNYPGQALTAQMESEPFFIDNTPPQISGLTAQVQGTKIVVRFKATDALTPLAWAQVSLNGGEWKYAEPTTKLTDSLEHEFSIELDKGTGSELTVAVKVCDERDNVAAQKTVAR